MNARDAQIAEVRRYKPYPEYKDSGVEWLSTVPAHWKITKMWAMTDAISGGTPTREVGHYWEGTIPWVSAKDMKRRHLDASEDFISEAAVRETGLKMIPPGSVLIVVRGMILAHTFPVGISTVPLTINQDLKALRLREELNCEFFAYWLEGVGSQLLDVVVEEAAHGTKAIRMDRWRVMPVEVPPKGEQQAITRFIDRETAKIDALLAKKERLIELLREKRAAFISRAVTKGLDPSVPMKDSGIEWLGDIPANWEVKRLRHLSRGLGVGVVVNPSNYVSEEGLPFLYGSDIREGKIHTEHSRRISSGDSSTLPKSQLRPGDLVMVRVGAPGVTAVVPPELDGANCASMLVIRQSPGIASSWLCYALNSRYVRSQVHAVQYGAAQEQFNVSHAVDFVIAVPPSQQQVDLAAFFDRETVRIDALIAEVHAAIDRLKELRTALISAAVTGKIDVREEAA